MSTFMLFVIVLACYLLSFFLHSIMLDILSPSRRQVFRRDERLYYIILFLAIGAHQIAFGADLVTTPVTQWGTDLALSAIVLLLTFVRFSDIYHAMKNQQAEVTTA
ncbi:MAG: hypothetical protein JWO84_784 [Parcubacteria group bacterium]|nr:hypothetical protein [Parcubacteria group bacterium]